jgi:hypothetical protein
MELLLLVPRLMFLDDQTFQVTQAYPRGGDAIALKASSARDCQGEFPLVNSEDQIS